MTRAGDGYCSVSCADIETYHTPARVILLIYGGKVQKSSRLSGSISTKDQR